MSVFIRRFTSDPGSDILLQIESVNILDLDPPASITGVGTGCVLMVGEFSNGLFNTVVEVSSASDLSNQFGSFGYEYNGVKGQNPAARQRFADSAVAAEFWNGNGSIQLSGKRFKRLQIVRVDTSVGSVNFTVLASLVSTINAVTYSLAPGQILSLAPDGSTFTSATFNATAGTVTSSLATYAVNNGDTVTLGYDGQPNFTVTFLTGDNTQGGVIARINAYAGFAFAATATGQFSLTGIQKGTGGQVRVVSASSGGVLTALGLSVATTAGTGNVANIAAVTPAEVATVVQAAIAYALVDKLPSGQLRVANTNTSGNTSLTVGPLTTATGLGFPQTTNTALPGTVSVTNGQPTITFSQPQIIPAGTQIIFANQAATTYTLLSAVNGTAGVLTANFTGTTNAATTATTLAISPVVPTSGKIPAGTIVQVAGGSPSTKVFVTQQDIQFTPGGVFVGGLLGTLVPLSFATTGPISVKIRHATDDGTGISATSGTVVQIPNPVSVGALAVTNPQSTTAALTEAAIDAQYVTAIGATLDPTSVARECNIIFAARQSNTVRRTLRQNAIDASSNGLFGRMAVIRPPIGTVKNTAISAATEPGVVAYRDQRTIYVWPQANTFVPIIALRGTAGGTGFTATGNVDVGADGFLASVMSQLNPEENPGQRTDFTGNINSFDTQALAQLAGAPLTVTDYINLKAAGICALRFDDGVAIFQSGVTTVDPTVFPSLVNIRRRRMADFIQDTIARRAKAYGKKLSTNARRNALANEIRQFLYGLLGVNSPGSQRIGGFTVDSKTPNTPDVLAAGRFRILVNVRTLPSMDSIELAVTAGDTVTVDETLPKAA